MDKNEFPSSDPEGTIPVPLAKELTANWRQYLDTSGSGFATHAFLIPIVAIRNIIRYNPDADGVRAYIGLENPADPNSGKLVLVPVIGDNDILYLQNPNKTNAGGTDDDPSNTYDLTMPCPPECAANGGLN